MKNEERNTIISQHVKNYCINTKVKEMGRRSTTKKGRSRRPEQGNTKAVKKKKINIIMSNS